MATIRIPSHVKVVSAEAIEALESKVPVYPREHAGMAFEDLPKQGCACFACNMASAQRFLEQRDADNPHREDLFDNGMTPYMLGHTDTPSKRDVENGYVTLDDFEHITMESMPAFLRPQAGEPRERSQLAVIDCAQYTPAESELLSLYLQFGVLDYNLEILS